MKKLILLTLLIVGGFAQELPSQIIIDQMSDIEKKQLYNDNSKKPLLAGILDLGISLGGISQLNILVFGGIPSLGHAYTNNWKRGVFSGLSTWAYSLIGMFNPHLGYTIIYSGHLLQAQDAIYLANQYNAELYKNIYGKEYIRPPKKSIIQKIIDKKEAKKTNPL